MKIALVSLVKDVRYVPIGLTYLATYLDKKIGFKDTVIVDGRYEDIHERIKALKPDLVGISSMTFHYAEAERTAREIRGYSNAQIVVGGYHITTMPHTLKDCFDFGVIGEGEETFREVVQRFIEKGPLGREDLSGIQGLVHWDACGKLVTTKPRPHIKDLDEIPFPDMGLVDPRYFKPREEVGLGMIASCGMLLTARGCPYRCVFCSNSSFWNRYRQHSVGYVVKNIRYLVEDCGIKILNIQDDMFSVNKKRLMEIRDLMAENGLLGKVTFTCNARSNHIDDEMCDLFKSLGVRNLFFGFESGSERMLKYLKVGSTTVERHKEAIVTCKRHGLTVYGSLIFGSPGETIEDMYETVKFIDFAAKAGADSLWCFVATPYPQTGFWDEAKKRGNVSDDMDWEQFRAMTHYCAEKPPLSDVDPVEFRKVYNLARKKVRNMRLRLIAKFIMKNPFAVSVQFIRNIPYYFMVIYNQVFHY